jgi:translation initiation factor 3 subunit I
VPCVRSCAVCRYPFDLDAGGIIDDPELVHKIVAHQGKINRINFNREKTLFITASKDSTAKLFDSRDLVCRKIFHTPAPINHAALSPLFDHVMTGGGQDAKDVTTTSAQHGKFMVRFFHTIYTEEFGRVKGHFGPVNSGALRCVALRTC